MNVIEFAIEKEKEEERSYLDLAEKADKKGLKKIFLFLAGEESKHLAAIEQLKESIPGQISDIDVELDGKAMLKEMAESEGQIDLDQSQVEIYREAVRREEKGRDIYLKMAKKSEDESHKTVFMKLADEEQKHFLVLDNVVDFLSQPEQWLENAEFFHGEEY
jgi:rubrerythrin